MSGIYIPGMEMPTSCYKCHLKQRSGMDIICAVANERFSIADVNILYYRLDDCPLVPVPEHGRVIDADAFTALMFADPYQDFVHIIEQMPTIIPADIKTMYYPQVDGITPTVIKPKKEETE